MNVTVVELPLCRSSRGAHFRSHSKRNLARRQVCTHLISRAVNVWRSLSSELIHFLFELVVASGVKLVVSEKAKFGEAVGMPLSLLLVVLSTARAELEAMVAVVMAKEEADSLCNGEVVCNSS